jgi:rhodanese-related sulfurtransferase/lysophospholipase L1-like esterase
MHTLLLLLCKLLVSPITFEAEPAPAPPSVDPKLPRILIIGDSISIGYTDPLRKATAGKANVYRIPGNGGPTSQGVKMLDAWLGDGKWEVIHFNFGLHDLKFTGDGRDGHQVPLDQYEENLRNIVARLKKTGAKLIWATTTPVPAEKQTPTRRKGDDVEFNNVARKVMQESGVAIDDLYMLALPRLAEIQLKANVHFTPKGYEALAAQVAASIQQELAARAPATAPAAAWEDLNNDRFEAMCKDQANIILDVRTPSEYDRMRIARAININVNDEEFDQQIAKLDKSRIYLVYCRTGQRSAKACQKMSGAGFKRLYNLENGITEWESAGKAVEK